MRTQVKPTALTDLENSVCDTMMAVAVLHQLVETDASRVFEQTKDDEGFATVTVSRDEAELLVWMAGDCLNRIKALRDAYYTVID